MKKVLLHIAAVLGLALVCITFMMYWPYVSSPGFMSRWKVSIIHSSAYLLALAWFFFAVRGLKKRECKRLWIYSFLIFLLFGVYLYAYFGPGYGEITWSTIKDVPYIVFFLLPPMLIPLLPLAEKGKEALPTIALFTVLFVAFGSMTVGWYLNKDWTRKTLFDPMDHSDEVFISDAYSESSCGLLLTVDGEGRMYAYVNYTKLKKGIGLRRYPTEIFSVHQDGLEHVFTKDYYTDQTQTEPVLSIPCMRGHIWYDIEHRTYGYIAEMSYVENQLFAENELGYLYCQLKHTDRTDVGADDPLEGRRPEDWPGVEWDMLDQHFVVGEDRQLSNENGMVLLWTYTDNCFFLAKRQEGTEGVIYEPLVCGRKSPGRDIEDWKVIDPAFEVRPGAFEGFTDYDDQNKGVIWPGEPLEYVRKARLKDGWTEAAVTGAFADTLCLFEKEGQRLLLLHAEAEASLWDDWTPDIDYDNGERLTVGYALFAPDGSLETYGGLVPVAAEQADHLLSQLNTRAKIGSFGYIDWQASWPARTRLTTDGRLILQNEAGEWNVLSLAEIEQ